MAVSQFCSWLPSHWLRGSALMVERGSVRRAAILTALPVEYAAVRRHLSDIREKVHPRGTVYEIGTFNGTQSVWEVGILKVGAGNSTASLETERAIQHLDPEVVLFVGVAGGLKDVDLGDVVVATKVYGYESGKDELEFKPRPTLGLATNALKQRAAAEAQRVGWRARIWVSTSQTPPTVHVGPIASGEKVVASRESATAKMLKQHYSDALAVEMEGYGFLTAVSANSNIEALIIRGISDLLDGKGDADSSGSQDRASDNASAFAFEVLAQYDPEVRQGASPLPKLGPEPTVRSPRPEIPTQQRKQGPASSSVTGLYGYPFSVSKQPPWQLPSAESVHRKMLLSEVGALIRVLPYVPDPAKELGFYVEGLGAVRDQHDTTVKERPASIPGEVWELKPEFGRLRAHSIKNPIWDKMSHWIGTLEQYRGAVGNIGDTMWSEVCESLRAADLPICPPRDLFFAAMLLAIFKPMSASMPYWLDGDLSTSADHAYDLTYGHGGYLRAESHRSALLGSCWSFWRVTPHAALYSWSRTAGEIQKAICQRLMGAPEITEITLQFAKLHADKKELEYTLQALREDDLVEGHCDQCPP